jgi:siroheme decarboxylase
MDETDQKLLARMENGIALAPEPFNEIALDLGITQEEVINRLIKLKAEGVIRKFGASIKPNVIGFSANALVAWKVPANRIQEVGSQLSKLSDISHCYERKTVSGRWTYNLYTVMHAQERQSIQRLVNQISDGMSLKEYKILYSTRDLKRKIIWGDRSNALQAGIPAASSQNIAGMSNF